jgi:hypothetical protein
MFFTFLGILSSLVFIAADLPYAIQTYKRKVQPHRVTWFIIFVLNVISFINQAASGASNSLWIFGAGVIATFSVFILSINRGVGGYSKVDIAALVGATIGLLLWWLLGTPLASIIATVVVSMIALVPTYIKSYHNPKSESKFPWLIASISTFLAAISVGKLDYRLLILPVYSTIVQAGVYVLLEVRGRQLIQRHLLR